MHAALSPKLIRVMIVDDSAVMRSLLSTVVLSDKRLEVAGMANNGESALRVMNSISPDLILLDVEMPVMDGLSTLKQIKASGRRIPVIMCSALTQRGAQVTIEALASGASDYVAKPSGHGTRDESMKSLAHDLIPKILAFTTQSRIQYQPSISSQAPPSPRAISSTQNPPGFGSSRHQTSVPSTSAPPPFGVLPQAPGGLQPSLGAPPSVLLIGVSTGGPVALDELLPSLPSNFPLPVLLVQHMPALFTKLLAERLNGRCPLQVCEAAPGMPVKPGTVYIAKGDWHMAIFPSPAGPVIRLSQEELENHCRPAVDVLFRTAVAVYGANVLGVILTGMGSDGLEGCRLIRKQGGTVFAQDQFTSAIWGMPGSVVQAGLAQRVLPLNQIAPEILRIAHRSQREASQLRELAV